MGYVKVPVKVKVKKETNKKPKKAVADKNPSSELNEPRWSVVTFESCAASRLTYQQAAQKLRELAAKKVSGLCIVTDDTAARISVK